MGDKQRKCNCSRRRAKLANNKRRERCTRLRPTLVYNPEKNYYSEPYMDRLRAEFSPAPSECSISGVELPWNDIAIKESDLQKYRKDEPKERKRTFKPLQNPPIRTVSSGKMCIPWEQLMVSDTIQSAQAKLNVGQCDSSIEIPWEDIMFDPNVEIAHSDDDLRVCREDEVEIPWNDLLVPRNIVFSQKIKKPPSCRKKSKTRSKKCNCSRR